MLGQVRPSWSGLF